MKIVVLDGYTLNPGDLSWARLDALGDIIVYERTKSSETALRIADADVVLTNKTQLNEATIMNAKKLQYIGVLATGFNVVNIEAAKARNIPVCNIPTYGTTAVAQFTIALLLELCHHVGAHSQSVANGEWERSNDWCFWNYPLIELDKKTLGIIGFGRIGQNTAKVAKALGMKVIAYDLHQNQSGREVGDYVSLDTLFAQSDVISLHCPLLPETDGIINRENIAKMKKGVIILNTSRGGLIVEEDMLEALRNNKIAGAAIDVVSTEPIEHTNPLLRAPNCIITPHIAWAPIESRQRLMDIAVNNLHSFISGIIVNNVWS